MMLGCKTMIRCEGWFVLMTISCVTVGCTESFEIVNEIGVIRSVGPLQRVGDGVEISYEVSDREGDDLDVRVEVCEGAGTSRIERCGTVFSTRGGDSLRNVTTVPAGQNIPHRLIWDYACGRLVDGDRVDSEDAIDYTIRVSVVDAEDSAVLSPSFRLGDDLGVTEVVPCSL
jgi:hypothetical protein